MGDVILIYVLGVVAGIIICGRFNNDELVPATFFWPLIVPLVALVGAVMLLYKLGQPARANQGGDSNATET